MRKATATPKFQKTGSGNSYRFTICLPVEVVTALQTQYETTGLNARQLSQLAIKEYASRLNPELASA